MVVNLRHVRAELWQQWWKQNMCSFNKSWESVRGEYDFLWFKVCRYVLLLKISSPLPPSLCRVLPLSVHVRYRESHQPVQHQWCSGSPCCPHQHHPEGPAVRRGWSQHQWGGTRTRRQIPSPPLLCFLSNWLFLPLYRTAHYLTGGP